ncbi:M50 family metallopeptidase [Peribacillus sp. SCS-155]|uniref:M50 family metallopeptidase n=1 Tax=Peribacillus sedimenti TaxID=3115297 RepID=UPI003906BD13
MNHTLPILIYLVIALLVTRIPYLGVYFSLFNTLSQEVVRVLLEGGIANKISLKTRSDARIEKSLLKNTFIAYAGYTGQSLAAIGLFYLVAHHDYHFILYLFMGLVGVAVFLWVRNFIDILWALSFVVLLALPIYFGYGIAIMHMSIFLSSFFLCQSIINGIQVCRKSLSERQAGSGYLARFKIIPAMIFGAVLVGQSLYAGYFIVKNIISLH